MKIKNEILVLEDNLRNYEETLFHLLTCVNKINSSIEALDLNIPQNQLEELVECLFTEIAYVDTDIREAIGVDMYESS